jgi:hypothetical protein
MKYIITESQYEMILKEDISTHLRRRLHFDMMEEDMQNIIEYELLPCEFRTPSEFVSEACDLLAQKYIEELTLTGRSRSLSGKDSDSLYLFLVDLFGKHLVKIYNKECS